MNNDKKLRYIVKYKDLYVDNIGIDYDSEFTIKFTSLIKCAKRFNYDNLIIIKSFIDLYFDDIEVLCMEGEDDA